MKNLITYFIIFQLACFIMSENIVDNSVANELWDFCSASYCSDSNIESWNVKKVALNHPNVSSLKVYDNILTNNLAYVGYNEETNLIFAVFRGTIKTSIRNWMQNIGTFKIPYALNCLFCQVHAGFRGAYLSIDTSSMIDQIEQLKNQHPEAKIAVTGHSLGGAMSTFFLLDVCKKIKKVDYFYTFGSPRVGNLFFSGYFDKNACAQSYARFTNNEDPVPHVPLNVQVPVVPALGFWHLNNEIYLENNATKVCNGNEDYSCANKHIVPINVTDHTAYFGFDQMIYMETCQ